MQTGQMIDQLLVHLDARVDAFAICEVADRWRLGLGPMKMPMFHYVLEGEGQIDGVTTPLAPGALVIIPAAQRHELQAPGYNPRHQEAMSEFRVLPEGLLRITAGDTPVLRTACAIIAGRYLHQADLFSGLTEPMVFRFPDTARVPAIFEELVDELRTPRFGTRALASALLKQAFVLLIRAQLQDGGADFSWILSLRDPRIARAVGAMIDAGDERLSTDALADLAGMSRAAFQRRFHDVMGVTVADFDVRLRLHRAALLLVETDLPVGAIASAIGYSSRSHFSRAFRKALGVDPSRFRRDQASGEILSSVKDFISALLHPPKAKSAPE